MEQNANDMLSQLLNDPAKLQSAISAASSLFGEGGNASPAPPRPKPPEAAPAAAPAPGPAPMIRQPPMMSAAPGGGRPASSYDPSAELMQRVMPVINTLAKSGRTAVNRDRANLLQSFKPFVTENVGRQFDHAIRLVSIARMAKSTMLQLGGAGGQESPGDGTRSV